MSSPEEKANLFSQFTYTWLFPLLRLGYSRPLQHDDLYELKSSIRAERISSVFDRCWADQIAKAQKNSRYKPKVWKALYHGFGREFIWSAWYRLVCDMSAIASPVLLQYIIVFLRSNDPVWYGYVMAIGMLGLQLSQMFCMNRSTGLSMRCGFVAKTALIAALFQKMLRLSSKARTAFTNGKVVNIMSTDTNRIDIASQFIHFIWIAPLQIIVAGALLLWHLGISALVGIGVILVFIPIQLWTSKRLVELRSAASKTSDKRVKITQEVLNGIKVIKLYAWEQKFLKTLEAIRFTELQSIRFILMLRAFISGLLQTVPILACVFTFILHVSLGGQFDSATAYFGLALFYVLRVPLLVFPTAISQAADCRTGLRRICELLLADEIESESTSQGQDSPPIPDDTFAVKVDSADFIWESTTDKTEPFLKNISFEIPKGKLVAIVGEVGSGKSSLLSALLGDMKKLKGGVKLNGSIAYCSQNAWIQNMTLRDNILFGKEYDEKKYKNTIKSCALQHDLDVLAAGDMTEIGEKGINLSGGQKQRVNIARAVYHDTDIIILDDPLSAVDAHVGTHLFEKCINGVLRNKTRLLVTHRLHVLPQVDLIIFMENGRIKHQGTYQNLIATSSSFKALMEEHGAAAESSNTEKSDDENETASPATSTEGTPSKEKNLPKAKQNIMMSEERAIGQVSMEVYRYYAKLAGGYAFAYFLAVFLLIGQGSRIASDSWLTYWVQKTFSSLDDDAYKGIYVSLGLLQCLLMIVGGIFFAIAGVLASKKIHFGALEMVFSSPMSWFDSQPLGRIINRFSRDIDVVDNMLPETIRIFSFTFSMTLAILILICVILPWFILPLVPTLALYWFTQYFYRKSSVEVKRLDNISRSPLFAHFSEALSGSGLSTIRAYACQTRFIETNRKLLNYNNRAYYISIMSQRWLSLRLEILASILVFFTTILGVILKEKVDPGLIGLCITYSLQVTIVFNWCVKMATETEIYMNSVERLMHYTRDLRSEAADYSTEQEIDKEDKFPLKKIVVEPDDKWPEKGVVEVDDLYLRYRNDLPPVLKGVSFKVEDCQKVGLVGRTGAGKSSLIYALFLLTHPFSGSIIIDGINILTIPLTTLRKKLAIIPQDPVVFSGTLRDNLDPFKDHSDDAIWKVLENCGLAEYVKSVHGLETIVAENGENWSVGQRQLICLARAMLKESKILILDEATASVDMTTDALIQSSLRKHFQNCTILTIAHRLSTIIDYDKIIVLDYGTVKEMGAPQELIKQKGVFWEMCVEQDILN